MTISGKKHFMISIKLEKFEGPLSLLLQLIEKQELDVTEVSLAKVADQFVEYIRRAEIFQPEEAADFLVVAARLLLIKSKALLPYLYPEEEQELDEFERQLKMYKEFVEAAKLVEKMLGRKKFMFAREFNRKAVFQLEKAFSPPKKLGKEDLSACFSDLIGRLSPPQKLEEGTIADKINIEDKISAIRGIIAARAKSSFSQLLRNASSKTEIIVNFLAALELMRQREAVLTQDALFGEIFISRADG